MKHTTVIAITGGPCAGKTCALPIIRRFLEERGYCVLTIPETATELMSSGAGYAFSGSAYAFQCNVLRLQRYKEDLMLAACAARETPTVILCDRGIPDGFAYMPAEEIPAMLRACGTEREEILTRYDAVFHLVSSALGAPESYGRSTNAARLEDSVEEAIKSDRATLAAWSGHPRLCVIDSADDFGEKLSRLERELLRLLEGEPSV